MIQEHQYFPKRKKKQYSPKSKNACPLSFSNCLSFHDQTFNSHLLRIVKHIIHVCKTMCLLSKNYISGSQIKIWSHLRVPLRIIFYVQELRMLVCYSALSVNIQVYVYIQSLSLLFMASFSKLLKRTHLMIQFYITTPKYIVNSHMLSRLFQ